MTSIKEALDNAALTGTTVTVAGWVRTFRNHRFIALNDGRTFLFRPIGIRYRVYINPVSQHSITNAHLRSAAPTTRTCSPAILARSVS